jgi:hypothetical protein
MAMRLIRRRKTGDVGTSPCVLTELERQFRRLRVVPLIAAVLMVCGWGMGEVTSRWLDVPDDRVVRAPVAMAVEAGQLEAMSQLLSRIRAEGEHTVEYVEEYREHIEPVERMLIRRGLPAETARKVAWPLVEHSYRRNLDPATVVAVMLIESAGRPNATSPVGARGLMQVMPLWAGHWRACGRDLYDIEANLCNGTSILAWYLSRHPGNERQALLGYNGCVRGTNTPNCHTYPDKVQRLRQQIEREIRQAREQQARPTVVNAAAAP